MPSTPVTTEQTSRSITRRLHEFEPDSYDWEEWEVLFDTYLEVDGVNDDSKKRNLLITALGVQPFKTLLSICKPKKPTECSYRELVEKLRSNYARVTFPSTERIKFFATRQESPRTLTDFANELRDKSTTCKFPSNFYEDALITAFVGGLQNDHVRKHLMQRNLETFEDTINTAKTIQSVLIEGSKSKSFLSEELNINKINKHRNLPTSPHQNSTCLSCGSTDHPRSNCRFRNVTCHKCNKEGHIAKVCRSKSTSNQFEVNTISSVSHELLSDENFVRIPIQIDGVQVNFELDTGSPSTIINEDVWKTMGKPKLRPVTCIYNSFSGHPVRLKGTKMVTVNYDGICTQLQLIVGNGNRNNILGRNWINALHLNNRTLNDIVSNNTSLNLNSKFDKKDAGEIKLIHKIHDEYETDLPIRASQIAQATRKDPFLTQVYHYTLSGWPAQPPEYLHSYYRIKNDLSTSNGCITWGLRTIIPSCFRNRLLNHLHQSHPGMTRMKVEARRYFWWPSLDKDIENLVLQWPIPDQPWKRIHIDLMGKFMGLHFLIIVDSYSKWLEVVIMHNTSTKATIHALSSLFARYGLCETIVSDNGTQFTSDEFTEFCARNGIKHITTSRGHPQSNGQAEHYVATVKSALKKGLHCGGELTDVLANFLFCYRTTPHATTNSTPSELFLKRQTRTVLDLLRPSTSDPSDTNRHRYQINFDKHTKKRYFQKNNNVLVRDFRNSPNKIKWTPGVLIDRQGSRIWIVKVGDHTWRRHENQIQHREWSTDDDVIIMDPTTTTTDRGKLSATSTSSSDQGSQTIRCSSRLRKPVRRLIEEI